MRPLLLPQDAAHAEFLLWMRERADLADSAAATAFATLWNDYQRWCECRSLPSSCTLSETAFGRGLRNAGCRRSKDGRGCSRWSGIALRGAPGAESVLAEQYTDSCPRCGAILIAGAAINTPTLPVERKVAE